MLQYIGTKVIQAEPSKNQDGEPGYKVIYPDGYESWSPEGPFEAYRCCEGDTQCLTFGDAIYFLKLGKRVSRVGWNGKGMWLELQFPTDKSKITLPYIYMKTVNDDLVPWLASQTDMLAEDWGIIE